MSTLESTKALDFIRSIVAEDTANGKWDGRVVTRFPPEPNVTDTMYLEDVPFPLRLLKPVCTHEDGSQGIPYLLSSDTTLTFDGMTALDRKRWPVEPYHKSLKQNASLEQSPTHTVVTQTNHFFAALCSYIKLEMLKVSTQTNHFALKTKLYLNALHSAYSTLRELQPVRLAA